MKNIMITGGAGFIGNHVIEQFLMNLDNSHKVYCIDKITYASTRKTLKRFAKFPNFHFIPVDILSINDNFLKHTDIDTIVHLAAESHVDNSIEGPDVFVKTNIVGTFKLLEAARLAWKDITNTLFYYISTDEVFGDLEIQGPYMDSFGVKRYGEVFNTTSNYNPSSPYSASKAAADHLVRAYGHTYGMNVIISNCSNNYGPYQHPEKLIPKTIINCLNHKSIPVYGTGQNVRDWIYVNDHAKAIYKIATKGIPGQTYLIGGDYELKNIEIVEKIIDITRGLTNDKKINHDLIKFVTDRKGHDRRYAIDSSKIKNELGWKISTEFEEGLTNTIMFYINHPDWVNAFIK